MESISFLVFPVETSGQVGANGCLATARNTHQNNNHRRTPPGDVSCYALHFAETKVFVFLTR